MNLHEQLALVKKASGSLRTMTGEDKNKILNDFANEIDKNSSRILVENQKDLSEAEKAGMAEAMLDRLKLTDQRIALMTEGIRQTASLRDPVGRILEERTLASGIRLKKVSVPFGVVLVIFEARPNVACDCAALCLKSGNACLLKGGKEAYHSNTILVDLMRDVLRNHGIDENAVSLTERISHEETKILMEARDSIDLLIPRGSKRLIRSVVENAKVPVIETGAGVCHVFVDESADLKMAENIVINAKCSRPSVCNAMETLLVHEKCADAFLPEMIRLLKDKGVLIHGDARTCSCCPDILPADESSWYTEYDSLEMNCRVVRDVEEAVNHIEKYGTHHSESIVSETKEHVDYFMTHCDSACVYHNASTRFTDGFEFGLGAEIGISTQKLHARGPMGLNELNTYMYMLEGNGETR